MLIKFADSRCDAPVQTFHFIGECSDAVAHHIHFFSDCIEGRLLFEQKLTVFQELFAVAAGAPLALVAFQLHVHCLVFLQKLILFQFFSSSCFATLKRVYI